MEDQKGRFRLSLLARVALVLAAVAAAPLAFLSVQLGDLNRRALEDQVLETHSVVARTTAARVDAHLAAHAAAAGSVASNPSFYTAPTSEEGSLLLSGLLEALPDLTAAAALNIGGEEILRAQRRGTSEEVEALLQAPPPAAVDVVTRSGRRWLWQEVPMPADRGSLVLLSPSDALDSSLEAPELGEAAELALAARDGHTLLGSESLLERLPEEFLAPALTGGFQGARRDLHIDGKAFIGAHAPLQEAPWFVVSLQPSAVAEATARRLRRQTLLAVLLAVLLTAAVSAVSYRSLVRPIRRLLEAQRKLVGLEVESKDELGQLRETFELLERRIAEKEALGEVFLDRFEVLEVIGEGAMGTVFRGWDPRLERPVALKTVRLNPQGTGGSEGQEELFQRLQKEAVLGARLQHENIVAVYDLVREGDLGFLAMELVDGIALSRYLWLQGGLLPAAQAVRIVCAVANGLAAAHLHGIVHHDVKPANVLLARDGGVKLADFGISRFASSLVEEQGGRLFGTPGYLPPEALQGKGYGPEGDLFALGCILHELLTGELPFRGDSVRQLIVSTLAGERGRRSVHPGAVPADLEPILEQMLRANPAERPPAAGLVVEELKALSHYWRLPWRPRLPGGAGERGMPPVAPTRRAQVLETFS